MVGQMITTYTKGVDQTEAYKSTSFAVHSMGSYFLDSQGNAWTANYLNEGGDDVRDLQTNIAAEAGTRQTYEDLIKLAPDEERKRS